MKKTKCRHSVLMHCSLNSLDNIGAWVIFEDDIKNLVMNGDIYDLPEPRDMCDYCILCGKKLTPEYINKVIQKWLD